MTNRPLITYIRVSTSQEGRGMSRSILKMHATLGRLKRPPRCCFEFRTLAVTGDRRHRRGADARAVTRPGLNRYG